MNEITYNTANGNYYKEIGTHIVSIPEEDIHKLDFGDFLGENRDILAVIVETFKRNRKPADEDKDIDEIHEHMDVVDFLESLWQNTADIDNSYPELVRYVELR